MNNIKLRLPLDHIAVTQKFGLNYLDFYQKMGLVGHPGIDFKAKGSHARAAHSGIVKWAGKGSDGGIGVMLITNDKGKGYGTFYYHHEENLVKTGDPVLAGQWLGITDNTGKYTTANHLHFELFETFDGEIINRGNGFNGRINPAPYFVFNGAGEEMANKDWSKSRCYHRYYRGRPKGGLFNETKILGILTKKGIWPTAEKINSLVYGGWDLETVINPSMYEIYSQLKKNEYLEGKKPFQN